MSEINHVLDEVKKVIVGKDRILLWVLTSFLARSHILLEDIPGVGKTTIALAFSKALGLDCRRVQFTPDVMPSDIIGFSIFNKDTNQMVYQPGAIICNLFLADELNRAASRTQSALLEAMEEKKVTVDGATHVLPQPFLVIATQNPVGACGTQLLPDSQLDRFSACLSIGYPNAADERKMVLCRQKGNPLDAVSQVLTKEQVIALQKEADDVFLSRDLIDYIVALIGKTRQSDAILQGASPRATLSVSAMAKAAAMVQGRDYVLPGDIRAVFPETIAHRLILSPEAEANGVSRIALLQDFLGTVPAPKV